MAPNGVERLVKTSTNAKPVRDLDELESALINSSHIMVMCAVPFAMQNAIQLGLPEILVNAGLGETLTPVEIAEQVTVPEGAAKADPDNVERILRLLASYNMLKETLVEKDGNLERRFGANACTKLCIKTDGKRAGEVESFVGMFDVVLRFNQIYPLVYKSVLDPSKEAQMLVAGKSVWEEYEERKEGIYVNKAYADYTSVTIQLIIDKYDGFKTAKTLVDVGGGVGVNIAAVVAKYPHIRGINFDQPATVRDAPKFPGVEHVGGSFFTDKIPECDTAYMKNILHAWNDELSLQILKAIHKALPEDGKLINVDVTLSEPFDDSLKSQTNLCFDYLMMAITTGGKQRTLREFQRLGAAAGFPRVIVASNADRCAILEFYKK